MTRFYLEQRLALGDPVALDPSQAHQLRHVLRLEQNDQIVLFNGDGLEYVCTLQLNKRGVQATPVSAHENRCQVRRSVVLCPALIKPDRMSWLIQKATELGVQAIHPLLTEHVDKPIFKAERWHRVMIEAAEQCGRPDIPQLAEPTDFEAYLNRVDQPATVLMPALEAEESMVGVRDNLPPDQSLRVLIGPEGGWSEHELDQALALGLRLVSLGSLTLRAETAALATLSHLLAS